MQLLHFIFILIITLNISFCKTDFTIDVRNIKNGDLSKPIDIFIRVANNKTTFKNEYIFINLGGQIVIAHELKDGSNMSGSSYKIRLLSTDYATFVNFGLQTMESMHEKTLTIIQTQNLLANKRVIFNATITLSAAPTLPSLEIKNQNGTTKLRENDEITVYCKTKFLGIPKRHLNIHVNNAEPIEKKQDYQEAKNVLYEVRRRYKLTSSSHKTLVTCTLGSMNVSSVLIVNYSPRDMNFYLMDGGDSHHPKDQIQRLTELYPGSNVSCVAKGHPTPSLRWVKPAEKTIKSIQQKYHFHWFDKVVDIQSQANVLRIRQNIQHYFQNLTEMRFVLFCQGENMEGSEMKEYAFIVKDTLAEVTVNPVSMSIVIILSCVIVVQLFIVLCLCAKSNSSKKSGKYRVLQRPTIDNSPFMMVNSLQSQRRGGSEPILDLLESSIPFERRLLHSAGSTKSTKSLSHTHFSDEKKKVTLSSSILYNQQGDPIPTEV